MNQRSLPVVTIITVTFNAEKYLESTIQSVINQTYKKIQYIIIDGGSTDNTLDIIRKYQENIYYWISEVDRGIYDAMNKGILISTGDWLLFLGADDYLYSTSIVENIMNEHISLDTMLMCGNIIFDNKKKFSSSIGIRTLFSNTVHHQSAFYNQNLFCDFNYDVSCKIYSDYEMNLIIYLNKYRIKYIDELICFCRLGGTSDRHREIAPIEFPYLRGKHMNRLQNFIISKIWLFVNQIKTFDIS